MNQIKYIALGFIIFLIGCQRIDDSKDSQIKHIKTVQYVKLDKNLNGYEYDGFLTKYSQDGKVLEKEIYNADGSLNEKWTFTYHENGKLETEVKYDKNKLIRTVKYIYDESDNIIEETAMDLNNELLNRKLYEYDGNGQNVKETHYGKSNTLTAFYKYIYDNNGNNTRYERYNQDSSLLEKYVSKYDSLNQCISIETLYGDGRLRYVEEYKYDKKGNRIEKVILDKERVFKNKTIKIYSDSNNVIQSSAFDNNMNLLYTFTHSDTENSERLKETWFDKTENITKIVEYEYTDNRDKLKEITFSSDSVIQAQEIRNYNYDKNGNWIQCVVYKNETPFVKLKRKIKYY